MATGGGGATRWPAKLEAEGGGGTPVTSDGGAREANVQRVSIDGEVVAELALAVVRVAVVAGFTRREAAVAWMHGGMVFWWWFCGFGVEAGVELDAEKPSMETAQHNGGGSVGGARLESMAAAERGGARRGGVPEAERGNGVGARLRHGAAKPTVVADWRGGGWSSGGGWPELIGKRRCAGAAWGGR
uniref:DUF834 domain-containing protein n=1 Tax=Oryza glaberrima TaxID=4538 RepID=I1QHX2_ORYGL